MRGPAFLLAALFAVACGPLSEQQPIIGAATGIVDEPEANAAQALDPRRSLTREIIEATPNELMLLAVVARDNAATAQPAGRNGDRETWVTLDGVGFVFQNGIVVATRGLGDDLMGGDSRPLYAALLAGGGAVTREIDLLDSQDAIIRQRLSCRVEPQGAEVLTIFEDTHYTQKLQETCEFQGVERKSQFWIDATGTIWQARQWISPGVGHLDYQRL